MHIRPGRGCCPAKWVLTAHGPWPVFFACWYVGEMATWLTRLVSKTQNPKPQIQILKPKSDMKRKKALKVTSY